MVTLWKTLGGPIRSFVDLLWTRVLGGPIRSFVDLWWTRFRELHAEFYQIYKAPYLPPSRAPPFYHNLPPILGIPNGGLLRGIPSPVLPLYTRGL